MSPLSLTPRSLYLHTMEAVAVVAAVAVVPRRSQAAALPLVAALMAAMAVKKVAAVDC